MYIYIYLNIYIYIYSYIFIDLSYIGSEIYDVFDNMQRSIHKLISVIIFSMTIAEDMKLESQFQKIYFDTLNDNNKQIQTNSHLLCYIWRRKST